MNEMRFHHRNFLHVAAFSHSELRSVSHIASELLRRHDCDGLAEWLAMLVSDELERRKQSVSRGQIEPRLYEPPILDAVDLSHGLSWVAVLLGGKHTPNVFQLLEFLDANLRVQASVWLRQAYQRPSFPQEVKLCRA